MGPHITDPTGPIIEHHDAPHSLSNRESVQIVENKSNRNWKAIFDIKVECDGKEAGNYATIREQSIPDKGYTQCKGLLKMQKTGGFKGQVEVSMLGAWVAR